MRVIFMGTPDFAVKTLEALVQAGHEVCLAVTQPDRPRGRGKGLAFSPVKEAALERGIPVYQPERIRRPDCLEELKKYKAEVMVVVAFGQILPQSVLELTPYGCINVHASLLPKYRGAAPIQWAILEGEKETGVTTMQMDAGLDTGDMILQKALPLSEGETGGSLHEKLSELGAQACVETLEALEAGRAVFIPQGETPTAYARMLTKEMGEIRWQEPAAVIERWVRGLDPWPSAFTNWAGKPLKIWKAQVMEEDTSARPGTVTAAKAADFRVQTGQGQLRILEVQAPGKKRMPAGDFLRGSRLEAGTLLG